MLMRHAFCNVFRQYSESSISGLRYVFSGNVKTTIIVRITLLKKDPILYDRKGAIIAVSIKTSSLIKTAPVIISFQEFFPTKIVSR